MRWWTKIALGVAVVALTRKVMKGKKTGSKHLAKNGTSTGLATSTGRSRFGRSRRTRKAERATETSAKSNP